jgi:hypothetical protein
MNNVDEHLEFKTSMEENRITNYFDFASTGTPLM